MCFHPVRRHLIAANLCSRGWHESLEMIVSVVVGFLYMSKERLLSSLVIVVPKK
jgi:chromosome condensin MukBEF MukE localization factor